MTWNYLQRAKKDAKRQATSRFSDYFTIWDKRFSFLIRFTPNIWLQSFEHCFTENDGHSRDSNISIASCVFFMGYNIYFFLSEFWVKNINKSQDSRERESLIFLAPPYHFHPLPKSFGLQRLQLSERFNDERGRRKRTQEPHYILLYQNLYKSK